MKRTFILKTILFSFVLISGFTFSQRTTTPSGSDTIQCTLGAGGVGTDLFEIVQLTNVPAGAHYSHLWWAGDNDFYFSPDPMHTYARNGAGSPYQTKMNGIITENYGNGGPPPLVYTFYTAGGNKTPRTVLSPGVNVYMQKYRNAVINDTMYLIVSYKNNSSRPVDGSLKLYVGNHAHIIDNMLLPTPIPQFLPNREQWNPQADECKFQQLAPNEERSILIPVFIDPNEEDQLEMRVEYEHTKLRAEKGDLVSGYNFYALSADVAHSHDPNLMLESSDAKNQCDYRDGKIHYTVKFQNLGDAPTYYVRVECSLDNIVNMDSISGIEFPDFYNGSSTSATPKSSYSHSGGGGAVYYIDKPNRKIIFEMHDLALQGTGDPNLTNLEVSRDQIEFDIKVKSNYIFGPATKAQSVIYFDNNKPIETNQVETICGDPISAANGGGFQKGGTFWDKWKWYLVAGFAVVAIFVVSKIRRRNK